ncbi:acyltransferase family protein [Actinorugispora endophytica]|uniref:Peptidoglycan/LPS O-acetylase OafA/YrhL n=1 Tax=Actinorugispora endophytica TaxID=1605990 RepID=A0A4R6V5F3_9ACTN|nr:acyltransferase family protein [Actinorugispora endophytica]TDQ55554.1 peptidoglycan/LPS O-acetylase OafA/YrhL [Actinorugispora endophytica]
MSVSAPTAVAEVRTGGAPPRAPSADFRPEIQGLRAVAVLLVVAYHVWLGRVSGGVDVFLLLTGFLITGSLVRMVERHGGVRYLAFWGRLLGRLTPAAAVVLLGTLAASALWLPQSRWRDVIEGVVAAALYHENWLLAVNAVDYLARDDAISPVQHFWSLSIQGQAYLLLPVLVALAAWAARRTGRDLRGVVAVVLGAVGAVSLGYSVWITAADQSWAYFDSGARIWELALGGVFAMVLPRLRLPEAPRVVLGWTGLAALVLCGILLQVSTMFPGWIALWPTGAALLVVLAGGAGGRRGAGGLLSWRPLTSLGDLSYALYLWHWPVLVVYLEVADRELASPLGGGCVVAVSLLLAVATKRLVEDGAKRFTRTRPSPAWSLLVAAVLLLPLLTAAGGWTAHLDRQETLRRELAADPDNYPGALVLLPDREGDGAGPTGPLPDVPVLPQPIDADDDRGDNQGPEGCHNSFEEAEVALCLDGPEDAEHTVVLAGQSHAAHWYTALRDAAESRGWRLVTMTKDACQFSTEPSYRGEDEYVECAAWNEQAMEIIADLRPDAVVTTATRSSPGNGERVLDGYSQRWRDLDAMGVPVIGIRDTPRMGFDTSDCVARHLDDPGECATDFSRSLAERPPYETEPGVPGSTEFIDLSDYVCPEGRCPAVVGNVLVYYDDSHMTATYSATLAPVVEAEIRRVTGW